MKDRVAHWTNGAWQLGDEINGSLDNSDWGSFLIPAGLAVLVVSFLLLFLVSVFRITDAFDRVVIFRLGRFHGIRGPGFWVRVPFVDRVAEVVSLRVVTTPLKVEQTMTRDTVAVTVEAVVFWRVVDAEKSVLAVEDYQQAIEQVALSALREAVGAASLASLLQDRQALDARIGASMDRRVQAWGLEVQSVDIQDVKISDALYDVMSRQAQAEQESQARVTLANSEIVIAQKTVEAARLYEQRPTALQLRQMQLVYQMGQSSNTILIPTDMASSMAVSAAVAMRDVGTPGATEDAS